MPLSDQSLFEQQGDRFRPTDHCRGPWTPDAQHGGPPSALLCHLIEEELERDERLVRLSVGLLAPIPIEQLAVRVIRNRSSRRVARVHAELLIDERPVAAATGLLLRTGEQPESPVSLDERAVLPTAEATRELPIWAGGDHLAFHRDSVEHRWVTGDFAVPGPSESWQRLKLNVVDDLAPTPHQRVAAVADLASGVSAIYSTESGFGLINADLDLSFVRPLVGDWVRITATTRSGSQGTGVCTALLGDEQGVVATSTQALLGTSFQSG